MGLPAVTRVPSAASRLSSRLPGALLLGAALSTLPGCSDAIDLVVVLEGLRAADPEARTRRLELRPLRAGFPCGGPSVLTLAGASERFVVRLPTCGGGPLSLRVRALDASGCRLADGATVVDLLAPRAETRVPLAAAGGCRVTIAAEPLIERAAGTISAEPDEGPAQTCDAAQPCAVQLPRPDARVTLRPRAGGGASFAGFSGACSGSGPCTLAPGDEEAAVGVAFIASARSQRDDTRWERPLPHGNTFNAAFAAGPDDVWFVGVHGALQRYHHGYVAPLSLATPDGADLQAVWGSSASDVWIVGSQGVVARFDGSALRAVAVPAELASPSALYSAVTGTAANDVYLGYYDPASGRSGVLRFDGQRFSALPWPSAPGWPVYRLWARAGQLFGATAGGVVQVFNGQRFVAESTGAAADVNGVWGAGADGPYAVRCDGAILRREGGSWHELRAPTLRPDCTASFPGLDKDISSLTRVLFDVFGSDAAVADPWFLGGRGLVLRGSSDPTPIESRVSVRLYGGAAASADRAWIVGSGGTLLRWDGRALLQRAGSRGGDLLSAWAAGPGDRWAVGDGAVLHDSGDGWLDVPSPAERHVAVWGSAADDVWFISNRGVLRSDGVTLRAEERLPNIQGLASISGTSGSDVWLVGGGGFILHYDGQTFDPIREAGATDLVRVVAVAPGVAWAVGAAPGPHATDSNGRGRAFRLRFTAGAAQPITGFPYEFPQFHLVWGVAAADVNHVYFVGERNENHPEVQTLGFTMTARVCEASCFVERYLNQGSIFNKTAPGNSPFDFFAVAAVNRQLLLANRSGVRGFVPPPDGAPPTTGGQWRRADNASGSAIYDIAVAGERYYSVGQDGVILSGAVPTGAP